MGDKKLLLLQEYKSKQKMSEQSKAKPKIDIHPKIDRFDIW